MMITLIFIIFIILNNSDNPYFQGFSTAEMIGLMTIDFSVLYFLDKFVF